MSFGRRFLARTGTLALLMALPASGASGPSLAPEFPTLDKARWIGTPVRMADLRGKVVLLDVWTFG